MVIPSRDRWRYLSRAVRAVLDQEDVTLELVVVDDGSTDETAARLVELDDPRVRVLRNEVAVGSAASRNRGLEVARGNWLAPLDDDDLWSPRKLRTQIDAAEASRADWAYGAAIVVNERCRPLRMAAPPPEPNALSSRLLSRNVIPGGGSNVIVRAELLRMLGGFDQRLALFDDWDLWIRLAAESRPVPCGELLVAYTEHAGNKLSEDPQRAVEEIEYLTGKHRATSRTAGVDFDRVALSRWIAWGHRRAGNRRRAAAAYLYGAIRYRSLGNVIRAAAILAGERAMRGPRSGSELPPQPPGWLARYT